MGWEQTINLNSTYKCNTYWLGCHLGPLAIKSLSINSCWKIKLSSSPCDKILSFVKLIWEWFWNYLPLGTCANLLGISWKVREYISISSFWEAASSSQWASKPGTETRTSSLLHSSHSNPKPRHWGGNSKIPLVCQKYQWNVKNIPTHLNPMM